MSKQKLVRTNVHVISGKANRIKNDATPEEIMKVANFMQKYVGIP